MHALETSRLLSSGATEEEISIAACILGSVRNLPMNETACELFKKTESEISSKTSISSRAIYNRSWISTSWRGNIQKEDLTSLIDRFDSGGPEEREESIRIICRLLFSPYISAECFNLGLNWLRTNISAAISPTNKLAVIDFATHIAPGRRKEASDIVLLAQPILAEHKGLWSRLEHFIVPWLQADLAGCCNFCLELAKANAHNWLIALSAPQSFDWFLSELRSKDVGDFVGRLVLSTSAKCRKLGLFFFDELEMNALPATMLDSAGEDCIKVTFYELQRSLMDGHALAKYLIMLIPCVQRMGADFQKEFFEELVRQLKNYGGACREEFLRKSDEFLILKSALEKADKYFEDLRKIRQSSVIAMEVKGYRQAIRIHNRKFSNEISKKTKEMSLIRFLCKEVRLLYGKAWSSFNHDKLGETSDLKQFSSSVEIPRLEIIDPEGMALGRLNACTRILELSESDRTSEESEEQI